jgi:major membrane immunogen (membrane-anchored lipoprotein)
MKLIAIALLGIIIVGCGEHDFANEDMTPARYEAATKLCDGHQGVKKVFVRAFELRTDLWATCVDGVYVSRTVEGKIP